jgi:hypothetical protein
MVSSSAELESSLTTSIFIPAPAMETMRKGAQRQPATPL